MDAFRLIIKQIPASGTALVTYTRPRVQDCAPRSFKSVFHASAGHASNHARGGSRAGARGRGRVLARLHGRYVGRGRNAGATDAVYRLNYGMPQDRGILS